MADVARALRAADPAHASDGDRITEDVAAPGAPHADALLATRIESALPEGVVEARRRTRWLVIAGAAAAALVVGIVAVVLLRDDTMVASASPVDAAPIVESHELEVAPAASPQPAPTTQASSKPQGDHKRSRPKKLEKKSESAKKGGVEKKTEKTTSQGEGLD
jgi:outer membrane biosynthesis protein TonB